MIDTGDIAGPLSGDLSSRSIIRFVGQHSRNVSGGLKSGFNRWFIRNVSAYENLRSRLFPTPVFIRAGLWAER